MSLEKTLSPIEMLDSYLSWFSENNVQGLQSNDIVQQMIKEEILPSEMDYFISHQTIIEKLVKDGSIKEEKKRYSITFEGKELHRKGGYKKKYKNENWENFPKRNWLSLGIVKYLTGAIVGAGITLLIQHITEIKRSQSREPLIHQKDTVSGTPHKS